MRANIGEVVAKAWEQTLRESPNPFQSGYLFEQFSGHRVSYRERLTMPLRNWYGDIIPRITIVRSNIRRLGDNRTRRPLPD